VFGVDSSEFFIVAIAALIFIGPKDLPRVMRVVGQWVGRARGMARHFTAGIENIIREAELEEMEKKWREENERIMRDHPLIDPGAEMQPLAGPAPAESGWQPAADVPAEPAAAPDAEAPELPLGPPAAPDRELP
jgi:sec-independent protein translocase protein TatB